VAAARIVESLEAVLKLRILPAKHTKGTKTKTKKYNNSPLYLRNFDFRAVPADVRKGSAFPGSFARRFEAAPQIISTKSEAQPRR
jgi:hypothetical protein